MGDKRIALGAVLASFYIDAMELDESPMIDGITPEEPRDMLFVIRQHLPIFDIRGLVQVHGRSIPELNGLLAHHLAYNELMCDELCNHHTRMLFRNMMFETSSTLTRTMPLMRREVHRIIFRLIEEQKTGEVFGHLNCLKFDMPYRTPNFVSSCWDRIWPIVHHNPHNPQYHELWSFIYKHEQFHCQLEMQFQVNEKKAIKAGDQNFSHIIRNRSLQREEGISE